MSSAVAQNAVEPARQAEFTAQRKARREPGGEPKIAEIWDEQERCGKCNAATEALVPRVEESRARVAELDERHRLHRDT